MQLSKENLLVIGVFFILLVLLSSQVINAFQASSANYYIRRTTTGIAGAEQSDGSRSLGTAYQPGANATGTNLEANIGFFEPYSAFYCTQNIDCPDGYFCNINQFCQEKLSDGQTCIGATFESTPLSEDEACSSGYCDNDAVGKEDDGWCFTTESGIYDNQDHKCEKSASPSLDDYSDELRNECHDTFGFVDDSCVFYSDGDDNNETCHCVPDATTGDLGKDWSIGGEITDCCGDDASEYYLESIYHLSLDSLVEYSDACCYSASSCIFNDSCYASGNVDYDIDEDGDKDYCNAGTWFDCNTDAECGEGYFCSNNDCVVLPTPSVDSVTPLTNYSLNSELGGFKIIVSGDRPTGYIYELQRDSNTIYTSSSTEYIDAGLSDNSRHCYRVRLTDEVSHYSEWSDELCNITSDRTGPASPSIALTPSNDANDNILISIAEQDDGLVLYLPFEEGSGSIARDWSPEHNDGTISGASWTDGNNDPYTGKALDFTRTSSNYVSLGDTLDPGSNNWTVCLWFNWDGSTGENILFNKESLYELKVDGGYVYFAWQPYWAWVGGTSFPVSPNTWNQVCVKYDHSKQYMYGNGVEVYSRVQTGDIGSNTNPFCIGGRGASCTSNPFGGKIDEINVYNRSLKQEEIIDLYQSGLIQHGISRANASSGTYAPVDGIYDDFNDGDISDWASCCSSATWTLESNTLKNVNPSDYGSFVKSESFSDFIIETSWRYSGVTHGGIVFRGQTNPADNGYQWIIRPSLQTSRIQKRVGGSQTYLIGGGTGIPLPEGLTIAPNQDYSLKLIVKDTTIRGYINDILVIEGDMGDTAFASGKVGFQGYDGTQWFDNVKVTPLIADINYIDEDADDTTPPETPSAPTVDAISLSELKVSWIDVPDYGNDYWYYTKSYDDEGNIDNFVEHPGFEDGVDHSSGSFGDYRITSEESYSGYYSLYANGSFEYEIHPDYRLFEPGHTYMLSAWVKEDPGCTECNQYLHSRWYFEDGSATTTSGGDVPNDGNWHYTFVVKTIPTGHGKVTGYNWYVGYDTNANSFRYIDNLEIKEVKSATLTSGVKDYFISGTGAGTYATTSPYTASGLNCFDNNCYTVAARDNALNQGPASDSTCEYPISAIICDYGGGPEGYCYNASSAICYYNGTGCPTCELACQGVGTACCPYQNTSRDNVTCSSTGCDYTDHDRDEAEGYCTSDADGCTPFYWSIGGEIANCCGDDTSEYRNINTFDATMDAISDLSDACCNSETKCVYNDTCYPNDAQGDDVDIDGDKDYCIAGTWFDCNTDAECNTAGGYHCVNNDCTLGCNANADCPENYFCNSSNKCHPKLIDGEICVGVTAESTQSSEDEACVSGYCDNDAVGDADDNWCFTPHNTYYDGNENTKCEYSAIVMNISSDEKTGNACDESNGWINSTCYYFNNGDDNEQTCSCIVDVDMFYAEGSNELRCCGDDSVSDVFCAGGSWYCHEGVKTLDGDVSSGSCSCFSQDWLSSGIGTNSPCCGDDSDEFFEQTEAAGASCCYNASVLNSGNASGAILCYKGQLYDCNNQHALGIETEIANCQEASDSGYYCDGDGSPAYWQYGIPDGCAGCQQNSECAQQTSFCDAENGAVEPLYGLTTDDNKCFQCTICGAGATRCSDQNSLCQYDCAADKACDDTAPYYCVVNETSDIYCDGGCLARDRDEAAEYCTKGDNDCTAFDWSAGGESIGFGEYSTGSETECCGDDSGENFRNTSLSGTYYSACCDSATDCVNSTGNCIDSGESWNGYYCINGFWDFVPTHDTPYIGSHRKNESSLVGYWTLDNDAKDSSGNANHGSVYGDASNTREGRVGGAYEFDGEGDYIAIPDSNEINIGGPWSDRTISLWFKANDINSKQIIYEEGGTSRGLNFYILDGKVYAGGWNEPENGWSGTWLSAPILTNQWYHIVLRLEDGTDTVSANKFKAYLNGVEYGSGEGAKLYVHSADIGIGAMNGDSKTHEGDVAGDGLYFNGTIDEVAIYDRALSSEEIEKIYNMTYKTYTQNDLACSPKNPYDEDGDNMTYIYNWYRNDSSVMVLNMPFDNNISTIETGAIRDYSPYQNNGTLGGGTENYAPTYKSGNDCVSGGCYEFDGTNDYIALDMYYQSGDSLPEFSVEVWYKTSFSGSGYNDNWALLDFDRSEWFNVYVRGDGKLGFSGSDGINDYFDIAADSSSNDGNWHQGVVVYDSNENEIRFYLDGQPDGTRTYSNLQPISDTTTRYGLIGDGSEATSFDSGHNGIYYEGFIDGVYMYNVSLTEEQIYSNYIAGLNAHQPDVIHFNETAKDERWKCSITVSDGITDSATKNSTEITIQNSPPEKPILIEPTNNNNSVINRKPEFRWNTAEDPDGDLVNYNLYINRLSCPYPDYCTGASSLQFSSLSDESFTPSDYLDIAPYEWKVEAYDSELASSTSDAWNFTIQPYVDIALVYSTTDFGTMQLGEAKNTSLSDPGDTNGPFLIRNNGNCFINVSINATPMFSTVPMNTEYYQYKVDEYLEPATYDSGCTMVSWNYLDFTPKHAICHLNFDDARDEAEIDLAVKVPSAEPPGTKESIVTISAEMD